MTQPGESYIDGVLLRAEAIDGEVETQQIRDFVVVLEDTGEDVMIELRLGDRKDTIWWMPLSKLEEGIRQLKRAMAAEKRKRAAS
jgi:hypothetical protein